MDFASLAQGPPKRTRRPEPCRQSPAPGACDAKALLRLRRQTILDDLEARLHAGETLPALYRTLASERIVDASIGFVVTENGEGMRLAFAKGFERSMMERCVRLDFGQGICGAMAATRQPMHVTDIQRSLDPMADLVREAGITAYAGEPLIFEGKLLGTLSFATRTRTRFDPQDILFFRKIAKLVASARTRTSGNA
jgi:GAF domain-containing protein